MNNQRIYEVNTRVWIRQFGEEASIANISDEFIKKLRQQGFDYVWMMGIWKSNNETIEKYCFHPSLISAYNAALPDWKNDDVIDSPYSIDSYELNPVLGSIDDLLKFKKKLNDAGIKLILDFIPNHFSSYSKLLETNPDIFLPADLVLFKNDSYTFFQSPYDKQKYFAHGRDPLFPPWEDTVQVNFFSTDARNFLIGELRKLTKLCDGVRCDMAMLPLNNVFYNTWIGVLKKYNCQKPADEFWQHAISEIKTQRNDFIFIAEAYWDLEWDLQQLGFDFTYDKRLTDRLGSANAEVVRDHLKAEMIYQLKSVRFTENHDEERSAAKFGKEKSLAAAAIISTIPGLTLYYDGQFEGRKTKLPLQLGRLPIEKTDNYIVEYYEKLLNATSGKMLRKGSWSLLVCSPVSVEDQSYENLLAWQWSYDKSLMLVIVNYSNSTSKCRLKFDLSYFTTDIELYDLLTEVKYNRKISELKQKGLFIELKPFSSHIFSVTEQN